VEVFAALAACVLAWFIVAPHLPRVGLWPAIAIVSLAVMPGTLLLAYVALPLWPRRSLVAAVIALALLAFLSFGFVLANADLLWRAIRPSGDSSSASPSSSDDGPVPS
jgi:hypothetical protein